MEKTIEQFEQYLRSDEKSAATVKKYLRDVMAFLDAAGTSPGKAAVIAYKKQLCERYRPAGVNSRLAAINRYLEFSGKPECRVRLLKIQRQLYAREDRELTRSEYGRLVQTAGESRIGFVLQTICGTGIRVSELSYITVEAVGLGRAEVDCKGKQRVIFIPQQVQKLLQRYIKRSGVRTGAVFVTRGGKPLDRSNIWREMKKLCAAAGVSADKVFPHNLRHLFARTFYELKKDIVRLADLLGHSSVNTTRIYTIGSGDRHRSELNDVGALLFTT